MKPSHSHFETLKSTHSYVYKEKTLFSVRFAWDFVLTMWLIKLWLSFMRRLRALIIGVILYFSQIFHQPLYLFFSTVLSDTVIRRLRTPHICGLQNATYFDIRGPVLHVFVVFTFFRISTFFSWVYSQFFTGFLIFPYESQTAGNLSTLFPLKQCPDIRGFDIHVIFHERIPHE